MLSYMGYFNKYKSEEIKMTKVINLGATCETCRFQDRSNHDACHKCMHLNGKQGWEPSEGVQVIEGEDWQGNPTRRVVGGVA
jgi:hypothetical protein